MSLRLEYVESQADMAAWIEARNSVWKPFIETAIQNNPPPFFPVFMQTSHTMTNHGSPIFEHDWISPVGLAIVLANKGHTASGGKPPEQTYVPQPVLKRTVEL